MKRLGLYSLLIILLLCTAGSPARADDNSRALLERLSERISKAGNYRVRFTVSAEGNSLSGQYTVSGDSYRLRADQIEVLSDGKDRYEISSEMMEVMIDRIDPEDRNILTNPTRAFDFAADSFTSTYEGVRNVGSRECDLVELTPLTRSASVSKIALYIARDSGLPARVEYYAQGLSAPIDIIITGFEENVSVDKAEFRFDPAKYEGFELVDFR